MNRRQNASSLFSSPLLVVGGLFSVFPIIVWMNDFYFYLVMPAFNKITTQYIPYEWFIGGLIFFPVVTCLCGLLTYMNGEPCQKKAAKFMGLTGLFLLLLIAWTLAPIQISTPKEKPSITAQF